MTAAETVQEPMERPVPWIEQRMADGRYTCSISEFAKLLGIKYERAIELCKSRNAPPGFYSGSHFKIWLPDLPDYMSDLAKKRVTVGT